MSRHNLNRGVWIKQGAQIVARGRTYRIRHVLGDGDEVEAEHIDSGDLERIALSELGQESGASSIPDLSEPSEEAWNEARVRADVIKRLLDIRGRRRADVDEAASKLGVNPVTVYRWMRRFHDTGTLDALLPHKPNGGRGKNRLDPAVEQVVQLAIETVYLQKQQRSVKATAFEVRRLCKGAGLEPPHVNTLRARIASIPEGLRLRRRSHAKEAADRFEARPGTFDDAQRPLAIVQIDHTLLDIELVDDQHRLPIGRPYLTLVFDVYSRMILGFHISLDPPGANGTGMALAHAILPKESWLAQRGINNKWPCYGFPAMVHLDNAREFRGEMLRRACEQYGIELNYRPVKRPHFGGHIERGLGTLAKEIHNLPGTTFSNPRQRGEYDAQGSAALTLSELERYIGEYVTGIYHQRVHSRLRMAPVKRWNDAILGTGSQLGMGLERPADAKRLRLDFMPIVERTIQAYGVQIDQVSYFSDVLRPYINARNGKQKRTFVFRRDPGDISRVFFWDPELKQYSEIPYRNMAHPAMSVWELRAVRRRLDEDGRRDVDEDAIFEAYERLRRHRDGAVIETKRIRRERARKETRPRPPLITAQSLEDRPQVVIPFPRQVTPYEVDDA